MLHHRSVRRVQSKMKTLYFRLHFCQYFHFFHHAICVLIHFQNLRNKVLNNQKQDLVVQNCMINCSIISDSGTVRSSHPAITLICNFFEVTLWHGCSSVNLLHIFRTPFFKNPSGWLLPNYMINKKSLYH